MLCNWINVTSINYHINSSKCYKYSTLYSNFSCFFLQLSGSKKVKFMNGQPLAHHGRLNKCSAELSLRVLVLYIRHCCAYLSFTHILSLPWNGWCVKIVNVFGMNLFKCVVINYINYLVYDFSNWIRKLGNVGYISFLLFKKFLVYKTIKFVIFFLIFFDNIRRFFIKYRQCIKHKIYTSVVRMNRHKIYNICRLFSNYTSVS